MRVLRVCSVFEPAVVRRVGVPVRRGRQLWAVPAALVALRKARAADVVHVHHAEDLAVLPIGAAAARAASRPLVVTLHTSLRHTLAVVDARTATLKLVGAPIESWATRRADAVIALASRGAALERGRPVAVIPSGVEPSLFAGSHAGPFPGVPRPRIVFVGRLAPQKDVATLIRARISTHAPSCSGSVRPCRNASRDGTSTRRQRAITASARRSSVAR